MSSLQSNGSPESDLIDGVPRRSFVRGVAASLAALAALGAEDVLAGGLDEYIERRVAPDLRGMARMFTGGATAPELSAATLNAMRSASDRFVRPRLPDVTVETRVIEARSSPAVNVLVINAKANASRPGILDMHGGGFVSGSAEGDVAELQAVCKALDCAAVSVEYRRAPETTYAGSSEDNYAALKWLHGNAAALGVDPGRIALMGGSAGGGHAALLAIKARDLGEVPVAFQCLTYPMLDDRTGSAHPAVPHVGRLVWTPQQNRFGWSSFLGVPAGSARVSNAGVPARVEHLDGLPPAFVGVGTLDLFFEENIEYARRLGNAGVPVELVTVPGAFHGFDAAPVSLSERFRAARLDALRRALS